MKKKVGLIVVLMMLVSICSIGIASAKEKVFSLTKAETTEKSSTTVVNKFSYKGDTINSDVTFHKVGDYVTYKLVLKNTTDDTITIKSVTDNNSNKNVTYSYDKNKGVKIKSGNTFTLLVKAKYAKAETDTSKRTKKLSGTFTINYVDKSGKSSSSSINVNPSTGDKIMLFSGLLITSLVVILVILVDKKKKINKKKLTTYLMILSLILPIGVSAATSVYSLSFNTTYKVMDKLVITLDINGKKVKKVIDYNTPLSGIEDPEKEGYNFVGWVTSDGKDFDITKPIKGDISLKAKFEEKVANLVTGKDLVIAMYTAAGDQNVRWIVDDAYSYEDHTYYIISSSGGEAITKIKYATKEQYNNKKANLTESNIISTADSNSEAYVWFDSGIIYYYSEANKIYMNEDSSYAFASLPDVTEIDLSHLDTSKVTDMSLMFELSSSITSLDLSTFNTSNVTTMELMFGDANHLVSVDVSNFDTSNVTSLENMFWECHALESIDVSSFDLGKVTTMEGMFANCESLTSLDLSNWDTSNVRNMSFLFFGCHSLANLNISNLNTSNATNISYMFWECLSLTNLDLRHFNTSNVENFSYMFIDNPNLISVNLSGWDLSSATDLSYMFWNCSGLENVNLSGWDTSHVTNMEAMFWNCKSLTSLDLSDFDTSNVTNMIYMFNSCTNLETIYASSTFEGASSSAGMFTGSTHLVGGAGTTYNSSHVNSTYARIDDPDNGKPGYFTAK